MNNNAILGCSVFILSITLLALLSLTMMAIPRQRAAARDGSCSNNLKYLGLGLHNYHSAYKQLPPAVGGTVGDSDRLCNRGRLSGFAALLPFIEQQAAWNALADRAADAEFPSMGPVPSYDPEVYELWSVQFDAFLCPYEPSSEHNFGLRSYMFCYGDGVQSVGNSYYPFMHQRRVTDDEHRNQRIVCRGAFVPGVQTKFRDVLDGLSNTILLSETVINTEPSTASGAVARDVDGLVDQPSLALKTLQPGGADSYRDDISLWSVGKGSRWPEGSFILNAFTTVLPPNSPSATLPNDPDSGCVSATSHHSDGVYVLMGDGAVRFVSNSIDTGNTSAPSVCAKNDNAGDSSPYGVWGAMGTRASKEVIPSERHADFRTIRGR